MDFLFLQKTNNMSFSTYTKLELTKKLKTQKTMFAIKCVVIVLMVAFSIFSYIDKGLSFHVFLPLFFIPMALFMHFEIKKIKKELALKK